MLPLSATGTTASISACRHAERLALLLSPACLSWSGSSTSSIAGPAPSASSGAAETPTAQSARPPPPSDHRLFFAVRWASLALTAGPQAKASVFGRMAAEVQGKAASLPVSVRSSAPWPRSQARANCPRPERRRPAVALWLGPRHTVGGALSGTSIRDISCCCYQLTDVPYLRPGPRRTCSHSGSNSASAWPGCSTTSRSSPSS